MKEKFLEDLKKLYRFIEEQEKQLGECFDILKTHQSIFEPKWECEEMVERFLDFVGLEDTKETRLAALMRIIALREDALLQVIDKDKEIIKERAFVWVSQFYEELFEARIAFIEKNELLTPFYRTLLKGAHEVGKVFSSWQSSWMAQIIYGINRELLRLFNGDEEKIFIFLQEKNLFDRGHNGEIADRSYSVLRVKPDGSFECLPYSKAFKEEVQRAAYRLDMLIKELQKYEDELKSEWLDYLSAIKEALLEEDIDKLVPKWADVDRAWMKITSFIQIGHPLEYYEDRFRKAVALEWDVRLANPDYPASKRARVMEESFKKLYQEIGIVNESIYQATLKNLHNTQLYVGRPFSFYGSEFNGLFSAQVVPNDEVVSQELGKKIFAYPDMVLLGAKMRPKMKITSEVFGKWAKRFWELLEDSKSWHKVYDISTIGHEFGHILWIDNNSESLMNGSGQFKNIEEFKATTGGLVAYFLFGEPQLWEKVVLDLMQRSVSLIGWMEVEEVMPYYVEGLLHLQALFDTNIFSFDKKLSITLNEKRYLNLKEWYLHTYKELAKHYLCYKDAQLFLDRFIKKDEVWLPKDEKVEKFVDYYYNLYKKIGRDVEE